MNLEDFSYFLPDDLIAQHPRPQRDASRMMMLHRRDNTIEDLPIFFPAGLFAKRRRPGHQ